MYIFYGFVISNRFVHIYMCFYSAMSHSFPPSASFLQIWFRTKDEKLCTSWTCHIFFSYSPFSLSLSLLWIDWTIKSWICVFHDEEMAHSICTAWDLIFSNVYWRSSTYNSSTSMWMWSVFHLEIVDNKKVHYSECHEVPQH